MKWSRQGERAREHEEGPGEAEEARILERARTNPAEFAPIYERYFSLIYKYCWRRTGQTEEAEDLTSLVFTRALGGLANYRGGSVAAWLFQIAHNAVANHLRNRKPQTPFEFEAENESGFREWGRSTETALEQLVWAEERERVARLIAALSEEQRELLALKIHGELSAKEIGLVVGKSEGAVRVALHRIVQQLRSSYRQAEQEEVG